MKKQITIYQSRNGGIYLLFGNKAIKLNIRQIEKFGDYNLYEIEGFDNDLYMKHYELTNIIKTN